MYDLQKLKQENKQTGISNTKESQNTKRTTDHNLRNFENFCQSKFNATSNEIMLEASRDGKDGIITVLQAWINWNLDRKLLPRSIRSMASAIKTKFYKNGGIILNKEDMKNLKFGKILKEARGIITADMIENLINHADKKRKALYLLQSCSAMRIGELLQLKKKHFDFSGERIQVNLSASMTKSGESRITFVSKECEKLLLPILKKLNDNDRVFPNKIASEQHAFRRISENAGYTEEYEITGRCKISTHTLRAYAITQMDKLNLFGFGHIIAGHGFYMKTYNRNTPEQLLEDYIKAEPYLQIFNRVSNKELKEVREELKNVKKEMGKYKEHWDENVRLATDKEFMRKKIEPLTKKILERVKKELREELLDEIKTPKVAEVRKCPTCNQESHDKIGYHYKCLNPDCEIDTFQE